MAEEPFIKKLNIFSDLKLRIGYGLAGNNRISYLSLLTDAGSRAIVGYAALVA